MKKKKEEYVFKLGFTKNPCRGIMRALISLIGCWDAHKGAHENVHLWESGALLGVQAL